MNSRFLRENLFQLLEMSLGPFESVPPFSREMNYSQVSEWGAHLELHNRNVYYYARFSIIPLFISLIIALIPRKYRTRYVSASVLLQEVLPLKYEHIHKTSHWGLNKWGMDSFKCTTKKLIKVSVLEKCHQVPFVFYHCCSRLGTEPSIQRTKHKSIQNPW